MEIDAHVLSVMESTISGDYAVYCLENGALHMLLRSAGLPLLSGMSAREYDALTEKDAAEIVLAACNPIRRGALSPSRMASRLMILAG